MTGELELPAFLKRDRVAFKDDRLTCDDCVTAAELAHISREVLVLKSAERAAGHMDQAGAMRPYIYSCRPWRDWFILTCSEA